MPVDETERGEDKATMLPRNCRIMLQYLTVS
ncbi:hypothetical protein SNOG_16323 [Parastagonospora nodorum SN15]|uniref:Uncharacterized protein n=1 Tax=Phaeosphaeria nodorum (strain SN15 / ATCC MYA-4574 / FGSC 10173) TaxID=321614 RepID=Q0TW06_PHANO|nr:hypothetical protein SNOG_16323 [Parastagonospora nodorum SN15]EAT76309.1 hypothetical protein SNOG_16323 [Parastagonospora nodorum SN15]